MGYSLACQVRMIEGLSHMDKAILVQLALATPKDSITVNIRLDTLAQYASCAERTARYSLRRLEKSGYLIPGGEKGGRGHALKFDIIVAPTLVEFAPLVPPPTNGHKPAIPPPADFPPMKSDEEVLASLKQTLQARLEQQAQREKPSRTLDNLIEFTKNRIATLEQKIEGEYQCHAPNRNEPS